MYVYVRMYIYIYIHTYMYMYNVLSSPTSLTRRDNLNQAGDGSERRKIEAQIKLGCLESGVARARHNHKREGRAARCVVSEKVKEVGEQTSIIHTGSNIATHNIHQVRAAALPGAGAADQS